MVGSLGSLFQLFDLDLEVLKVLLLSFAERPLGSAVLRLAFLASALAVTTRVLREGLDLQK